MATIMQLQQVQQFGVQQKIVCENVACTFNRTASKSRALAMQRLLDNEYIGNRYSFDNKLQAKNKVVVKQWYVATVLELIHYCYK